VDEAMAELLPRFFYVKKPLMSARVGHPTQKPDELMKYLVKLVSFEGETVIDPFVGSGSTGVAALLERRNFIGIEKDEKYAKLARSRCESII
jgi:DNA modification methylase